MKIDELKSELQEKEKERNDFLKNCIKKNNITGKFETILSNEEKTLGLIISAEISTLKKGISACEEILSQRNQKILEIIRNTYNEVITEFTDSKRCCEFKDELIKQLTNSEGKEK